MSIDAGQMLKRCFNCFFFFLHCRSDRRASGRFEFVLDISGKVLYNEYGSTDIEKEWMYDD